MLPWLYLIIAGAFEIVWAVTLKYILSWKDLLPIVITISAMEASVWFLYLAQKQMPIGTAYAVWTGIGTIGTVIFGMIFFQEPHDALRLGCLTLIILGVLGLKLISPH